MKTREEMQIDLLELMQAIRRVDRDEALEAAAKVAETWGGAPPSPERRRARLAAAIRAMKSKP